MSSRADTDRRVVSRGEAAQLLDCHVQTIDRLVREGQLSRIGTGRYARITMRSISRLAPPVDDAPEP